MKLKIFLEKKFILAIISGIFIFSSISNPVSANYYDAGYNIGAAFGQGLALQMQVNHQLKKIHKSETARRALFNYLCERKGVNYDKEYNEKLTKIMTELTSAVEKFDVSIKEIPYTYFIAKDETLNAACTIGHIVMVNEGTFKHMPNDDELAAILAHEMGHGQKNHSIKSSVRAITKAMLASAIAGGISGLTENNSAYVIGNVFLNREIPIMNKKFEIEADNLAWEYIIRSNYNVGACAAAMQRLSEMYGEKAFSTFFNPADHPDSGKRRDNYANKLYDYSRKHVYSKNGVIFINKKCFTSVAPADSMSSAERAFLILGNLAKLYHQNKMYSDARVENGTVMIGNYPIITPAEGDESAEILASRLNEIK